MDLSDFENLKMAFDLFRSAVGLAKDSAELLPDEKGEPVKQALEKAEQASKLAEAQIAKVLGYNLCQCTFPPQIMLSKGYGEYQEQFECPNCKKRLPPPPLPTRQYRI